LYSFDPSPFSESVHILFAAGGRVASSAGKQIEKPPYLVHRDLVGVAAE
jgi:hypothetical protein